MKYVAVIGSVKLTKEQIQNASLLIFMILEYECSLSDDVWLVSGGAKGIDSMAENLADLVGVSSTSYRPRVSRWWGIGGFKERNIQIAEKAGVVYRIATMESETYGSGWTADYAEKLGKPVFRYWV